MGGFFNPPTTEQSYIMTRDELKRIVRQSTSTTLVANRFRRALGLREIWVQAADRGRSGAGKSKSRYIKRQRYQHAERLMKQKHGVNL